VQVGVAHATCLHAHKRLTRAGIRHDHSRQLNGLALAARYNSLYFVRHRTSPFADQQRWGRSWH